MTNSVLKNTGRLTRFIIRRDRVRVPLWLIGITFFTLIVPIAYNEMYDSQQDRDVLADTMRNPAMTAMVGPGGLDNYTIGAMTTHQMLLFTAITVGIMSILLVNRHTRADEEDGRMEMIRSLEVGRLSNLNATLLVLSIANTILALINGFGLYALGIEGMDLEGSLLYGTTLGVTGIFFTGVTAIFAQLTESSRGTIGFSIAALLIAYFVRAIGDVSNGTLSWLSPLGWVTQTGAYSDNNWWPIVWMIGASIFLFFFANYLNAVRDLGAGFLPAKPGKKYATAFLQNPVGLALRLQRTAIIAWAVGIFVMGLSYGSVFGDLDSFFEGNELLEQMLASEEGFSYTEQFIPMLMMIMSILASIPTLMSMLKLSGEEKKSRIDHLLGRAVSRTRLMGSYVIIAIFNGFMMISLSAIGLWAAASAVMEEPFSFGTIYGAAMVYYPAMLVMIGCTVFLIGYAPKLTGLIWIYLFYSFFVLYLGGLFDFPDWVGKLTPFGYIPQLPVEDMEVMPIFILVLISITLMVSGFVGYNRRDID
ncbi:ABC transporter permease [Oceanobacillus salinisoli]|uniref:ABC transporter permease n=1 Tax=Oceanobacillus salinisoli TaxID=2678611 RepID=UPI0012E1F153|nr:ABC transporter permease [Oceanobacillus salinisoli]